MQFMCGVSPQFAVMFCGPQKQMTHIIKFEKKWPETIVSGELIKST